MNDTRTKHVGTTPGRAAREFSEWASLFSDGLFVKIVVYVDESGTHDLTGQRPGAREATIAGYAAPPKVWKRFRQDWQAVLNRYSAPYFHFCEWADAFAVANRKRDPTSRFKDNPYSHLDVGRLNTFIVELARIAGAGDKAIVGVGVHTRLFHKKKEQGQLPPGASPYHGCAGKFFEGFCDSISNQKRPWKRFPVSFFFDQAGDNEWKHAVLSAFDLYRKQHPQFRAIAFADKKETPNLPLQAADMLAYRVHQISANWVDDTVSANWAEFDEAVFKPAFDLFDRDKVLRLKTTLQAHWYKPGPS